MKTQARALKSVALMVAVLWATNASAQCIGGTCRVDAPPAVVRVMHTLGPCRSYGSGTIIHDDGRHAVVLSCAHLFREGMGQVQVRFPDGRTIPARPKAIDTAWDLSALEIDSLGITPINLAPTAPLPGQRLRSCGFGPNGVYQCNSGTAQGYTSGTGGKTYETLCLSGSARDGDSGGPVLNLHGELVGVLWGTDGRTVHATYCGRIRRFLAKLLPGLVSVRPPSGTPPPSLPTQPPSSGTTQPDRFDTLAQRLEQAAQKQQQRDADLASRLQRLEKVVSTIGAIHDRLQNTDPENPSSDLRSRARKAVGDAARTGVTKLLAAALPGLLAALGWTAPPSLAAILALRIGLRILRRRVRRKRTKRRKSQTSTRSLKPLNDQYASQLNELYALSGRSSTADATLGREYDRQLREMEAAADDTTSRWAHNLRRRVADRFLRIHDDSPLPADPIKQTA